LNTIAFNVGYHNEHHDLPSIPWNHLPAVRRAAPELYDSLIFHTSWTRLLFRFLFDPKITLFSRQVRVSRGGVALNAGTIDLSGLRGATLVKALDAALGLRTLVRLRLRRKFAWVWMATTGAWALLSVVVVAVLLRG